MNWYTIFFIFSIALYGGVTIAVKIAQKKLLKKSAVVADEDKTDENIFVE